MIDLSSPWSFQPSPNVVCEKSHRRGGEVGQLSHMACSDLKHLFEDTELRVRRGQRNADRQREAVSFLECANHDATIAKRLLILFEKANEIHVADRDRLIKELKEGAKAPG